MSDNIYKAIVTEEDYAIFGETPSRDWEQLTIWMSYEKASSFVRINFFKDRSVQVFKRVVVDKRGETIDG